MISVSETRTDWTVWCWAACRPISDVRRAPRESAAMESIVTSTTRPASRAAFKARLFSGSTATVWMPCCRAAVATPANRPPPPTATTTVFRAGNLIADLIEERSCAGGDQGMVVGMGGERAGGGGEVLAGSEGFGVLGADQANVGAVPL